MYPSHAFLLHFDPPQTLIISLGIAYYNLHVFSTELLPMRKYTPKFTCINAFIMCPSINNFSYITFFYTSRQSEHLQTVTYVAFLCVNKLCTLTLLL